MIYYFSGTGNSRYAANRIGGEADEELRFIPSLDPYKEHINESSDKSIGFVFPIYAWGVPPIVLDFISRLPAEFVEKAVSNRLPVWCVATCGDETGKGVELLRKALFRKGLSLCGAWSVILPNVYVLLPGFGTDTKFVEQKKLRESVGRLRHIGGKIRRNEWEEDVFTGSLAGIKTALIFPLFRKWGVNTAKWHTTEGCRGCGICARTCPVGNIVMQEGRPKWGKNCTSCCACYHVCPSNSAQYGKTTQNQGQFFNEEC